MKVLLIAVVCTVLMSQNAFATLNIKATGAVLVDSKSGRVLYGKNEETPLTMASTTKIMTAILVLENSNLDDIVTISKNAANAPQVRMNLSIGEEIRLEDLLYAMMLKSYNDAAVALAEHVSGSVEKFCEDMTIKAKEIGAQDTVFGSPNGLDSNLPFEKHHSTPLDMALITRYAINNPKFLEIINTKSINIPIKPAPNAKPYTVYNANRFLSEYDGAIGVKTGYTNKAGQCFVGAAKRDDIELISVVLASGWGNSGKEQKWRDTKALMDYGFNNFTNCCVLEKGALAKDTAVIGSPTTLINAQLANSFCALLSKEELDRIEIVTEQMQSIQAPVNKGENLGYCLIMLDGEPIGQIELISAVGALPYTFMQRLQRLSKQWSTLIVE